MFKNYLIVAFRNFWRKKVFSIINISGLSIGISAALVMFLIVYYEFSYDKFEPDADRIYRVVLDAKFNGTEGHSSAVPAPLGSAIENEVTGVEKTIPVFQFQGDMQLQKLLWRPRILIKQLFIKSNLILFLPTDNIFNCLHTDG